MNINTFFISLILGVSSTLIIIIATASSSFFISAFNNGAWTNGLPPMGVNTWCDEDICGLIDECPAHLIMEMADGLVNSGMKDAGYNLVELDDCWSATSRDANGNLQADSKLFPNGIKPVIDYVHSKGLKFGLYLCIGTKTCRKGRPGSFGYYEKDSLWLQSMGVDLIKVDNCNRPSGYTDLQLYTNFSNQLNKSTTGPIYLSACQWGSQNSLEWHSKVSQSWRIQMDHLPFYGFPKTKAAGAGICQATTCIIEYVATLPAGKWSSRWGIGDPDFLMTLFHVGKLYTLNFLESRTEFSFWSFWSANMIMATRDFNISQEKKSIVLNTDVISINQDALVIPGWKAFNNSENTIQAWIKPLSSGAASVLFWNRNLYGPAVTMSVDWIADLQFNGVNSSTDSLVVFDLWSANPKKGTEVSPTKPYTVENLVSTDVKMLKVICNPGPCLKGWW